MRQRLLLLHSIAFWTAVWIAVGCTTGCGTTRWTDTDRTGTEQLLVSDSIDQAVSRIDFSILHGQNVFLDIQSLSGTPDQRYLISTVRESLMASGCNLMPAPEPADYIVELRSGGIGTDRNDRLLLGVPQIALPIGIVGPATTIPEIALIKETEQTGVAKIAVFAYEKPTGRPIWKSGLVQNQSRLERVWLLGAGPYEEGHISRQPQTAMHRLAQLITSFRGEAHDDPRTPYDRSLWQPAVFAVPEENGFRPSLHPDVPGASMPAPPPDILPDQQPALPLPEPPPRESDPTPPQAPPLPRQPPKTFEIVDPNE
jgi:hypothetical protein